MGKAGAQSGSVRIPRHFAFCIYHFAINWWAREDLHLQGSQTLDLRGLLFPLNHSPENENENWSLQPVMLRQEFFTKEIRRLLRGGENGRSLRCCPGHSGLMKPA